MLNSRIVRKESKDHWRVIRSLSPNDGITHIREMIVLRKFRIVSCVVSLRLLMMALRKEGKI